MKQVKSHLALLMICVILGQSCRDSQTQTPTSGNSPDTDHISAIYHGNLPSPEYDSIVNHLTMFPNETFELQQVDRIAEHHLNEQTYEGIYVYLADSTRLGLYSHDGYLMLQFLLTETGLLPMYVHSEELIPEAEEWKRISP